MRCPAILIQQIAVFVVQADGIAGANADGRFKRAFCKGFCLIVIDQTAALGIHHQQCSRGDRAPIRETPAVIVGIVPQLEAGDVQRLRAGIHQLHPVIRAGVDLVEHQSRFCGRLWLGRFRRGRCCIDRTGGGIRIGKAAIALPGPCADRHTGIGIAVDLCSAGVIQNGGIRFAQSEVEIDRFFKNQECAGCQNGALRQRRGFSLRFSFLAFIIGQIPAGDIHRLCAGVGDLHPVIAFIRRIRFHLVDDDGWLLRLRFRRSACRQCLCWQQHSRRQQDTENFGCSFHRKPPA